MDFSLHAPDPREDGSGVEEHFSGEAARYTVKDSGVLVVLDGKGRQLTYAPGAWWMIDEAASRPPPPGWAGGL